MKNTITTKSGIVVLALSACSHLQASSIDQEDSAGRIVEFKSGPEGFDTKNYFYIGKTEVVAFDSQFTSALAEQSIAELRKVTKKPISYLVITHPNPDKLNGASVFKRAGAKIVASQRTADAIPGVHAYKEYFFVEIAKMFPKGTYPQPTAIDETFDRELEIDLGGGDKIDLYELQQSGVSSNQTVAWIESSRSLVVGDLIHSKAHAWLEGGIVGGKATPTLEGWIDSLQVLAKRFDANANVLAGRGQSVNLAEGVDEQVRYLLKARSLIDQDLKRRGKKAVDYQGSQSQMLYAELTKLFERSFVGYSLSYMIQYGAYGLVNQRLEK